MPKVSGASSRAAASAITHFNAAPPPPAPQSVVTTAARQHSSVKPARDGIAVQSERERRQHRRGDRADTDRGGDRHAGQHVRHIELAEANPVANVGHDNSRISFSSIPAKPFSLATTSGAVDQRDEAGDDRRRVAARGHCWAGNGVGANEGNCTETCITAR